ncbi:MAG: tetratricopeptide repeat protein [Tannerellaceae bacterium]|nr:tetratricopeptide repeat protein [Tannerellaceae bacterium]
MKLIRYTLYLLPFFFICCQPKDQKKEEQTSRIEKSPEEIPDAIMQSILELEPHYNEMTNLQKAVFGVTLAEQIINNNFIYLYQEYMEKNPVTYLDFSIQYFRQNKETRKNVYCYLAKGMLYKEKRQYKEAIENLLEATELNKHLTDNNLSAVLYFQLGSLAGFQNENEKALEYFLKAVELYKQEGNTEGEAKVYTSLSWTYTSLERDKEALASSRKALELTDDPIRKGDALLDIGNSYFFMQEFDSALYYTKQSLEYPYISTTQAARYNKLANVYAYKKEFDSAYHYAKIALTYPIDIYFESACYSLLSTIAAERGDKNEMIFYINNLHAVQDSITKIERQPNIQILEQIRLSDKKTLQVTAQRSYLLYAIFFVILISSLIVIRLYRNHQQKKKEVRIYKTELEQKEEVIDSQQEELSKRYELLLLNLADELKRTKDKYAVQRAKGNFEQRQQIDRIVYDEVLHLQDEKAFITKMNHILNALPDKLKEKFPEITYKEIVFCCLLMLKLSSNEIAFILEYKQTSLYKFKQRLIKKLGFATSKEFEQLLHDKVNY